MLWPIMLPLKIAFWVLAVCVAALTFIAPLFGWRRSSTFLASVAVACLALVPSCTGLMYWLDGKRFGVFHYANYAEVKDFRVERYLPPAARDITLEKYAQGHRARYTITQDELRGYIDACWREYGEWSSASREDWEEGKEIREDQFEFWFDGTNWELPRTALQYHSPSQDDGGGAQYYFDPATNTAYQHAGYW